MLLSVLTLAFVSPTFGPGEIEYLIKGLFEATTILHDEVHASV